MFSFPSWPRFPSVSLPAAIQRRFLSFILKRTLGHLVKPGQLDPAQIDAQIGSGFVQVNDVELDHDAINKYLADLPVPFVLETGSIGKVSARIPWPNLLTAPLALSLSSLSLTFVHSPRVNLSGHPHSTDDLMESVASMAESFVQDELSARESEALQHELNVDHPARHQPPGSIDPFLSTEDLDSRSRVNLYDDDDDDEATDKIDPSTQGVSIVATLIERLLARFEFDASDLTIRLILPKKAGFTFHLGQLTYNTEITPDTPSSDRENDEGEVRVVKLSKITISTHDIKPQPSPLSTASRQRSASPDASSSSSEDNEESMMMMSQSLACLPPPPSTRSVSPESSMYHSATTSVRSPSPETLSDTAEASLSEERILSLAQGSDSVVFRLVTPRLIAASEQVDSGDLRDTVIRSHPPRSANKLRLTVSIGPVAIALSPIHARSLLSLSSTLTNMQSVNKPANMSQDAPANTLDISCHIRSVTCLFLRSSSPYLTSQLTTNDPLHDFFLARSTPSQPPHVPHLRIQFDILEFRFSTVSSGITPHLSHATDSGSSTIPSASKHGFKASLADLSVFAISSNTGRGWSTSPVLISDLHLSTQYKRDTKYPSFEVVDWTKAGSSSYSGKVSQWRVRPLYGKRKSVDVNPSSRKKSPGTSHRPVLEARIVSTTSGHASIFEVDVIPLHLFIDVGLLQGAIGFIATLTASPIPFEQDHSCADHPLDTDESPPATPRARSFTGWQEDNSERERRRLENLVISDFTAREGNYSSSSSNSGTTLVFRFTFLRFEMRVPYPPESLSPRSGVVVMDLHDMHISQPSAVSSSKHHTTHHNDQGDRAAESTVLGSLHFSRLLLATALPEVSIASTFLSITTQRLLSETQSSTFGINAFARPLPAVVLPSVCIRSHPVPPSHSSAAVSLSATSSFSFDAHLPVVYVSLTKPLLDGLTFWADDFAQRLFGDLGRASVSDTSGKSRDPSMIGSRFFVKRTASTGSSESGREVRKSEVVVKVSIGEAQVILLVPRKDANSRARPLNVKILDIDFLAEIKPEGKDETVVTMRVMDLEVCDVSPSGETIALLQLTIPRDVVASSKPLLKLRYISVVDNDTNAKESRLKLNASGFTYFLTPDIAWVMDVGLFAKAPDGAFESVIPSERTKVSIKVIDGSFHAMGPNNPGAMVAYVGELDLSTDLVGDSQETLISTNILNSCVFFIDDKGTCTVPVEKVSVTPGSATDYWKQLGYALLAEVDDFGLRLHHISELPTNFQIHIDRAKLKLHACADTLPALGPFISSITSTFQGNEPNPSLPSRSTPLNPSHRQKRDIFAAMDEDAFRRMPDLGPAPDMIHDDLPTNLDYLDASFGAAAGLRELRDDDLFDFEPHEPEFSRNSLTAPLAAPGVDGVISNVGGETIRMLVSEGIHIVEGHFDTIPQETTDMSSKSGDTNLSVRVKNCDLTVLLYEGYDWLRTRKTIEQEVKAIRRRLVKIRQLLASGQTPDDSIEETSSILFNSVSIGLPHDPEELEPAALIAAIDEELSDGAASESASQSSWQSFKPRHQDGARRPTRLRGRRLERSRNSQIDFRLSGVKFEADRFYPKAPLVSRILLTIKDLEILDHIKTSTWKKFLTELRTDFRGNVRETASDMVRAELRIVHPVPDLSTEEGRLRAKVLPIKLHVDQDALEFMKKFFSFENPGALPSPDTQKTELYFQHVEVFPVDIKLDYKPKRVDYKALREGRTIELMNFFHFDGADITLRHITLSGITGWPRLFDTLNDLWTPDVKANQLADIISGVSPVRSLVNVGSGVADLVLLPIAQYKKDKRLVRGVQKGTTSFVKSTAMEAIKLGARLATGTQVILEQAESVLGGQGQFRDTVTTEALQSPQASNSDEDPEVADLISKYADQPQDVHEGMQSAYRSLTRNFNSAAQTILAVPMEVYERSGNEGPVRAIVRAVPIAVLKPMIGASEAVSKTLFGLRNSMDPEVKHENEAKYKQR